MAPTVLVDRRQDIALVFLLCSAGTIFLTLWGRGEFAGTPAWLPALLAAGMIVVSVGLWRAAEWARWTAGLLSAIATIQHGLALAALLVDTQTVRESTMAIVLAFALAMALFWAAIAVYLLRPSTRRMFAKIRATHAATR